MARRIAWHVAMDGVPKKEIVAFTFTERAAEEMKFRIRKYVAAVTPEGADATLGDMYVGTIHGFCLDRLRSLDPDTYHNFDVLDDVGRLSLVERGYYGTLGLGGFATAAQRGQYAAMDWFLLGYDMLNEYALLDVKLCSDSIPWRVQEDADWCKDAILRTKVGSGPIPEAFAQSAARYYALLRARRFLDFSTAQNELVRLLESRADLLLLLQQSTAVVVVDEVQDLNPVQSRLVELMVRDEARLTAVGDHRQAIFGFRGSRVDIMADLYRQIEDHEDGEVVELTRNYRSTPRIIELANRWARRIGSVKGMTTLDMQHGKEDRIDDDPSHVACIAFPDEATEAKWIASAVARLVDGGNLHGAAHGKRGIGYADVGVLLRSSTSARVYMKALQRSGIPAVFRAGPDLFSQPEVLLFTAALLGIAGIDDIIGSPNNKKSLPSRIADTLGCQPKVEPTIKAAVRALKAEGLPISDNAERRLLLAVRLFRKHLDEEQPRPTPSETDQLASKSLRKLLRGATPRRVFPQSILLELANEFDISAWDNGTARGETAMFHLGALSTIVTGIESSGWTSTRALKSKMIALALYGAKSGRTEEAPLLVQPDAVSIATIHAVKGLEFAAVFVADVRSRRFPSQFAKRQDEYPFAGKARKIVDPANHADNANYDAERRLMYVALTRAERFLFVTTSQPSLFYKEVSQDINASGGLVEPVPDGVPVGVVMQPTESRRDFRLVTSFSDLRYFLECPHDFYLRKVLGFAPTIDQAFGYGRGVHNLLRAIHSDPARYAALAANPAKLEAAVRDLVSRGLFYMRYTTGPPLDNLENRAVEVVTDYVKTYADELSRLTFEPERPFETLLEDAGALVSGAIDIVRLDEPPRVTLVDFKSGESESDISSKLDSDEMRLQVTLYGLAAQRELEYEPERGLVRYLGEEDPDKRELEVPLNEETMRAARNTVVGAATGIRERRFRGGPTRRRNGKPRCRSCDFENICGIQER